jgi:uncharacterized protein (DUF58 family)
MRDFVPVLFVLFLIAVLMQEDTILTIFYLLAGVYLGGRWWSQRALNNITLQRQLPTHAFLGEAVPVRVDLKNPSWLPVVWLRAQDTVPVGLATGQESHRQVTHLGPYDDYRLQYVVYPQKRGYYQLGPLLLSSGDALGLVGQRQRQEVPAYLTVYPRIVPLAHVPLPSRSPLGTLRHSQPIFEDPTRIIGKRDYSTGDTLRRIDWKSTAAVGRLQVKQFEPSIALETTILLNLHAPEYEMRTRTDASELAIVVAASLANWIAGRKQTVGLATNGFDPLNTDTATRAIPARKGRAHLMRLLEVLARVQVAESMPLVSLLHQQTVHLAWGTTLIIITSRLDEPLLEGLLHARRAGLNAVVVLCGYATGHVDVQRRAQRFGFPVTTIRNERDLDVWRTRHG